VERTEDWPALGDNIIETILNKSNKGKDLSTREKR